jgi:L-fuconolactonase
MLNIVDTHVHFWDPGHLRYDWMVGNAVLEQVYRPDRLPARGASYQVERLVFVEADRTSAQGRAEVEWVAGLAEQYPIIGGIVAFAPLERGEAARPDLEWLSRQPLVKGVRRLTQAEPMGFGTQPDFVRGVALLAEYGLSFDLGIRHVHLRDSIELVRQCPAVSFVVDHIGKPDIKAGLREPWWSEIKEMASLPNVRCKLSGMVTETGGEHWQPADLRPYIDRVIEVFGPERVMFGSDWPVSTLASTYERWVETLEAATAGLPEAARRGLWHDNGLAFYRLGTNVGA